MRLMREAITVGGVLLLMLGYGASQWFALTARATEWARVIDVPAVRWLAFGLLSLALLAGLWPDRVKGEPQS
jgi:hypothetical protein